MPRKPDHGRAWERILETVHDGYRRDGRAIVWRANPPVRVLSRLDTEGRFRACWDANGPPDFLGAVCSVPVAFEAKSVESARFPCANLPRHQAMDLGACQTQGGTAFIALRAFDGVGWVVPWLTFGPKWWDWHEKKSKRASFRPEEIGVRMPTPGDWLPVLARIP